MVLLIVLDGWGVRSEAQGNAIAHARKPCFDRLLHTFPHALVETSGEAVGLPKGLMGNSEVGHLNIGAGRVVDQPLTLISKAIASGCFFDNKVLREAMTRARERRRSLHLIGLLSDGRVHSAMEHVLALLDMAKNEGVERVYVHASLDGRDTPPKAAAVYIDQLEERMSALGIGRIATVSGRFYGMDRDGNWDRISLAFRAYVKGEGFAAASARQAVIAAYARGETDEFVQPTVVDGSVRLTNGDSVVCFNFREERVREITRMLTDPALDAMRGEPPPDIFYVCMTPYLKDGHLPVAFPMDVVPNVLAEVLSNNGLRQLHAAETEKYAHVTFFLNGRREKPFQGEDRRLVPSPKVHSYDTRPMMSACELTQVVQEAIGSGVYDFVVMNYANADMVGHTGVFDAAVAAVETVDTYLEQVVREVLEVGGDCLITADHGNAEEMIDPDTGEPHTAHTTNPGPLLLVTRRSFKLRSGILADIAPTVLELMGVPKPSEMTGRSLLQHD